MRRSSALARVALVALVGALVGACAHIGTRPEAQILTAERRRLRDAVRRVSRRPR
jgi:hypothetical protein